MLPSRAVLLVFLATLSAAFGQTSPFTNADFELGQAGRTPPGWFVPRTLAAQGFTAVLTTNQPASGKMCVEIRWPTNAVSGDVFANLMQSVDASPWRGQRVKITGAIRVASTEAVGRAQMWLRVDRGSGTGAFDNMGDRPVQRATWADYSISAEIADDATRINLGLMTFAGATAWFDNVRVETLGRVTTVRDPARPLEETGLLNLVAFTHLLGLVRHYHPSDAAVSNDWLRFVVDALPSAESARDPSGLAKALQDAFRPVAPTVRVFETGKLPAPPQELYPPAGSGALDVRFWEHEGYGQAASKTGMNIYHSERRTLNGSDSASLPVYARPTNTFRADLGAGTSCAVPTALFADGSGTLPHSSPRAPAPEAPEVRFSPEHRGARLATVMLTWNILQHFYPYFDVVGTDWEKELTIALRSAATDKGEREFYRTLNRLVVQLHDGHANLMGPGDIRPPPILARVDLVEGKVVVTGVSDQTPDLKPGDVVERIEGRPAREVFDEIAADISGATPQWRNHLAAFRFGPKSEVAVATLEVSGADGTTRAVKVPSAFSRTEAAIHLPAKIEELKPGVFYVDVTRLKQADFDEALPKLAQAKGLVFELRGYPTVNPAWLTHLSTRPLQSATWNVPKTHRPNRTDVEWETSRWDLPVGTPQLTTNRAFLTDGSAISYAESTMGIIEAYELGAIVGEPTAGTNGNINPTDLPLGYKMVWTGMKVLKHDGSPHHGVGILPTVPVPRTIKGIREGRDEQLAKALSLVDSAAN